MQSRFIVCQLTFMNDKSSLVLALKHLRNNLIERHHVRLHARGKQLQRKIGRRQFARNRDTLILDLNLGKWPRRNNHRPIPLTHAAAARHQRV